MTSQTPTSQTPAPQQSLQVAAVQHSIVWEDPARTFARVEPLVERAARSGANLVVLTEMFSTGFSMDSGRIAEPVDGPSVSFLVDQAAKHDIWICASVPTQTPEFERPVNQLVVCDGNAVIGRYNKIHPFSFAGEDEHYDPGTKFLTLDLNGVATTFFICYDLRFANEFWETASETDLYVVVANWPAVRRQHWTALLRARAIENQAYVVGVNRVGHDGNELLYEGDSTLLDPLGQVLVQASGIETVLIGGVDPGFVNDVRTRFPFAQDRRTVPATVPASPTD